MITATFTEYRLPNGSRHQHTVELPDTLASTLTALRELNCLLEAERLRDGQLSFTIASEELGIDLDIRILPPGKLEAGAEEAYTTMLSSGYWLTMLNHYSHDIGED